jgi:hypothetical protein
MKKSWYRLSDQEKGYHMDKRTKYVEKLSAQIVEWDVQINNLKDQAEIATAEAKFGFSKTVSALQLKRDQAAEKLQGIAMARDDDWEDMKEGAEQIWEEAKRFFKGVKKRAD